MMPTHDDLSPLLETAKRIMLNAGQARLSYLTGNQDDAEVCLDAVCRLSRQLTDEEADARRAVRREKERETVNLVSMEEAK
jgi:hypothetical protein